MDKIVLKDDLLLAKGGERFCFIHPEDKLKIIKTLKPELKIHNQQNELEYIYYEYLYSNHKIEDLLNTNPNEFFLQFADSLKGMNAVDLAKTLDTLKLNDNEVKMVLGAASKNTDLFREKIDLANQSLAEGTSLTKEFDIKNNNFAATLEKIKKTVS